MNFAPEDKNRRLLIVDDTTQIHTNLRKILNEEDRSGLDDLESILFGNAPGNAPSSCASFDIDSAFQGPQALDMVRSANVSRHPYALAFVDIRMPPGWDGIETLERIFSEDEALQCVICSAHADYDWLDIRRRLPQVDRYLILKKPFEAIEARQSAAALTEKWNRQAEARAATARLKTESSLSRALMTAASLDDVGPVALEIISAWLDAPFSALWVSADDGGPPRPLSVRAPQAGDSDLADLTRARASACSLPARVFETALQTDLLDLTTSDDPRAPGAAERGVRSACAFPITAHGRVVAVLELWQREPALKGDDAAFLVTLCIQLGYFLERRRTQDEAALRQERESSLHLQFATLAALSTPLIPLSDEVVVMPLVGEVDIGRMRRVRDALLNGITERSARIAILDVTGVSRLAREVGEEIVAAARAVELLGAQLVITGISLDAAQQIVAQGLDLRGVVTLRNLQSGIALAMGRRGQRGFI